MTRLSTSIAVEMRDQLPSGDVPHELHRPGADGPAPLSRSRVGVSAAPVERDYVTIEDLLADEPFHVAHRCGGGDWPEFSEPGVLGSTAAGYQALELSVHECASGEFVCSHDPTTQRMTGETHPIGSTTWSTLSTLTQTAAGTSNPSQPGQPLLRLQDVLELAPQAVLFLDHKETSHGSTDPGKIAQETRLLEWVEANIPDAASRVVWKVFAPAYGSRARAAEHRLTCWGIYYEADMSNLVLAPRLGEYELLGQEWSSSQQAWDDTLAPGVPVVGHILGTAGQVDAALSKGARGLMCSIPLSVNPAASA